MWLEDLQEAIVAQSFVASASSVVIGPPSDDDSIDDLCIALVDRQGTVDETYGAVYGRPNLTLVIRSKPYEYSEAHDLAMRVFLWMSDQANVIFGTTSFVRLQPVNWPGRLRVDSKNRMDITAELSVWLDENGGVVGA